MQLSVIVEKEGKFYVARVPDIGVTTQGKSFEEAVKNAKEAAELYMEDPLVKKQTKQIRSVLNPIFTLINVSTA